MEKLRVGIIGTGRSTSISRGHLMGIIYASEAELTAVYDLSKECMDEWCAKLGVDKALCCSSLEELFEKCDAVTVATPNNTHADYILRALEEGKHILIEKPISNTSDDIPRILEAAGKSSVVGMVNLSYRRIPGIKMIRDYIASGKAGRIYTIRHNMGGSRLANEAVPLEWRFRRSVSGTGCIGDFGSHALDILHYITGEDVKITDVSAYEDTFIRERSFHGEKKEVENEDAAVVAARLSDGALYSLLLSRVGMTPSKLEVVTERAILRYSMNESDRIYLSQRNAGEGYGEERCIVSDFCRDVWHGAECGEVPYLATAENVQAFLETVIKGGEPEISLEYGCRILDEVTMLDRTAGKGAASIRRQ